MYITATYEYRLGTSGGAAGGFVRKRVVSEPSPMHLAAPLIAPGRQSYVAVQTNSASAKKNLASRSAFSSESEAWIAFLSFDSA